MTECTERTEGRGGMRRLPGVGGVRRARHERVATMQRARRLASTAVVAVLAVSGLSACRAEPGVAAYVGDSTITEARVEAIYADAERKLAAAADQVRAQQATPGATGQPVPDKVQLSIKRTDVVQALLGAQVLGDIAKQRNVPAAEIPAAQVAQSVGLPENAEYVAVYVRYRGYLSGLAAAAKPVKASATDMRQVYDRFKGAGGFGNEPVAFEQFAGGLNEQDQAALAQSIGLREQIKADVGKLDLKVNPRYGIQELALLPFSSPSKGSVSLVGVPLDAGSDAPPVVDRG